MLTPHGPRCDVCGDYILFDTSINPFHVKGVDRDCHCHDKCKDSVRTAKGNWKALPPGPLRRGFEQAEAAESRQGETR